MDQFSTFDVARIFSVDRTRLQTWLDKDFFSPNEKARGKGTKAIFTLNDLYRLQLFLYGLELFGSRNQAKSFPHIEFEAVGPGKGQFQYFAYTLYRGKPLLRKGELLKQGGIPHMTEDKVAVFLINLQTVKAEVDQLLRA